MIKTINVTRRDLREGARNSPNACPVQRAVQRHVRSSYLVRISRADVIIHQPRRRGNTIIWADYHRQSQRVDRFDDGKRVRPFSFKLNIPKRYLKT